MAEEKEGIATSPEQLAARIAAREAKASGAAPEPIITEGAPAAETTPPTTPAGAPWIDEFNKTFGTQYKSVDEVKPLTELPNKLKEYQEKETSYKAFVEQEKGYKAKIAEYESSLNPLKYFSNPDAYIAEQLRIQHPDKNPILLQEIATVDLKGMDDLTVLKKAIMLEHPDLADHKVEAHLLRQYGIDKDTPREEWDDAIDTAIKIEAGKKRKELGELKKQINLPEVLTPEQREAKAAELRESTKKAIEPYTEKFAQFDKFNRTVGDKQFEFVVPDDYKESLKPMFEAFFLAGNEVNENNLEAIQKVRDGQMLLENFDSVYRAIESDVEARIRKEHDIEFGNTTPPNTAAASDEGLEKERTNGMGAFLQRN